MAVATISYCTSEQDASRFWDAHRRQPACEYPIPEGFPTRIVSSFAWDRSTILSKQSEWVLELSEDEVKQLEAALGMLGNGPVTPASISLETFPIPDALHNRLRKISQILYHGFGIAVLKGLDSSRYTPDQNAKLFAAFHTDSCEILALYALELPHSGGRPLVTSQSQLYNELAARYPDTVQTLANDWTIDTFQDYEKHPPKSVPFIHQQNHGREAIFRHSRFPITGFETKERNAALPPPTEAQIETLNAVQFLAAANSIAVPMEKGDLMFLNNMALMHGRESYEDDGDEANIKRHLLKMFLRDPAQDFHVPESLKLDWERVHGPNREDGTRFETWCPRYHAGLEEGMVENG